MTNFVANNVSSGDIIYAADHNELGSRIAAVVNGNLDDNNISAMSGSKVTAGTLPATALDTASAGGWISSSLTFTYSANDGGKEFVLTPSADPTSLLSAGMKFKVTRGTTPPTQCMAFTAASSQSASKSSPSGITFTGNFACEAWIYLLSYPSATAAIVGRDSAAGSASGWEFAVNTSGQLLLVFRNASGSTSFTTFQSLPLNRWVHVAAAATVATPTVAFYMNAVSVPGSSSATAATSVVQASTSLALGKGNNSTGYLNGYLSEVRVWSTAQTQANIKSNMAISLTGSESNLAALFQGNGNFNDKTSNANNLTANNSAIATQAANPYNATEYAVITKVASNAVTVFTGTDYTIPDMTLSSPYYSTSRAPNGGNWQRTHWVTENIQQATATKNTATSGTWQNTGASTGDFGQITLPIGEWDVYVQTAMFATSTTSGPVSAQATLSSANNSATNPEFNHDVAARAAVSTIVVAAGTQSARAPLSLSSQTVFYRNLRTNDSNNSNIILNTYSGQYSVIRAECAYI